MRALHCLCVLLFVAVAGCGSAAGPASQVAEEGSRPPATLAPPTATPGPSPMASRPPDLAASYNVAYESSNPTLTLGDLDVAAPEGAADLPVVVMFHGSPAFVDKGSLADEARVIAGQGYVVFVPNWDHGGASGVTYPPIGEQKAAMAQVACAMAFVRDHAADYGGDPARIILFGHSGGANAASVYAFSPAEPSPGCLGKAGPVDVRALVTWDGDFALGAPDADPILTAAPEMAEVSMPWGALASRPDLPVEMLVSGNPPPDLQRPLAAGEVDGFLASRDPSGTLAAAAKATGVLADGVIDMADEQVLFDQALRAQGNPGTLMTLPHANHAVLGVDGFPIFEAAIAKAAGE